MTHLILLVFAFVLAMIEALCGPAPWAFPRVPHFGWLAVALYFLALLLAGGAPHT
jgi:hypothetical protein